MGLFDTALQVQVPTVHFTLSNIIGIYHYTRCLYLCHQEIGQNPISTQQLPAEGNHLAGRPGGPSLTVTAREEGNVNL